MRRLILLILLAVTMCACHDSKVFRKADGSQFIAEPYGWADYNSKKMEGVMYDVSVGNIIWSILCVETVIVPVVLTGWYLFEPVRYIEPNIPMQ